MSVSSHVIVYHEKQIHLSTNIISAGLTTTINIFAYLQHFTMVMNGKIIVVIAELDMCLGTHLLSDNVYSVVIFANLDH